jgi:hypothetical protein
MNLNLQKSLHRQNLTSIHVKIFQRLDASAAAGCKEEDVLNNYGDFISWLLNMIINNLIPGANMQRLGKFQKLFLNFGLSLHINVI